jgi:hypothetical protein
MPAAFCFAGYAWLFFGVSQAATVARYRSAASSGKSSEILQQVTNPHRSQAGFFCEHPTPELRG